LIPSGPIRISSTAIDTSPKVAFMMPDRQAVLSVLNSNSDAQSFVIQCSGRTAAAVLEGGAVATHILQAKHPKASIRGPAGINIIPNRHACITPLEVFPAAADACKRREVFPRDRVRN
jgi:hypothetical protein